MPAKNTAMESAISHTTVPKYYAIKRFCLKINEFGKLDEAEKMVIIKERGMLLTELEDQLTKYQLYLVDDMYVEVISDTKSGQNKSVQVKN